MRKAAFVFAFASASGFSLNHPMSFPDLRLALILTLPSASWAAPIPGLERLSRFEPGRTRAEKALWSETALDASFNSSKQALAAERKRAPLWAPPRAGWQIQQTTLPPLHSNSDQGL